MRLGGPERREAGIDAFEYSSIVMAEGSQSSDPDEQNVWLEGKLDPVHVVLEGGHEIYEDDPAGHWVRS